MCIQWTRGLYSDVITRASNSLISQYSSPCKKSRMSGQCSHPINNILNTQTTYENSISKGDNK